MEVWGSLFQIRNHGRNLVRRCQRYFPTYFTSLPHSKMKGSLLFVLVGFTSLVFVRCVLTSRGCDLNRLSFGGRLVLANRHGQDTGVASPWADNRLFIFQTPRQSRFSAGHHGRGRIWVTSGPTACDRSSSGQQYCLSAPESFPCFDSRRPCHVIDVRKPLLSCPSEVNGTAARGGETIISWDVTCEDDVDGNITSVCTQNSGSIFSVGSTGVNCSCTDNAGNDDMCSFDVTVRDMTNPSLSCPSTISELAARGGNAAVTWEMTCEDDVDGSITPVCTQSSGSIFSVGSTPVSCSCADNTGNRNSCLFDVTVSDTTSPSISCPPRVSGSASPGGYATVTWEVTCEDDVDGSLPSECTQDRGSTFSIGSTGVNCSCTDNAENYDMCSFDVLINDVTNPSMSCPAEINKPAARGGRATVTWEATCRDDVDGSLSPECTQQSGSSFSVGSNSVNCSCTDHAGNRETCSFDVTLSDVTDPSLDCPSEISESAARGDHTTVMWEVTCEDDVDGSLSPECTPDSGSIFSTGSTSVNCSCTDNAENFDMCSFDVLINDLENPTLSCPSGIIESAARGGLTTVTWEVRCEDGVDGSLSPVCTQGSGSSFSIGSTGVNCSCTDNAGNRDMCSFDVILSDDTAPTIHCPSEMNVEAVYSLETNTTVSWQVTCQDGVDGSTSPECTPPNGSHFDTGTTNVTCWCTDAASNRNQCSFPITVMGLPPPAVNKSTPNDITVSLPGCGQNLSAVNLSSISQWVIVGRNEDGEYFNTTKTISDCFHQFVNLPEGRYTIIMYFIYVTGDHGRPSTPETLTVGCRDLEDLSLSLATLSKNSGIARIVAHWDYRQPAGTCQVLSHNITIQRIDRDNCDRLETAVKSYQFGGEERMFRQRKLFAFSLYRITLHVITKTKVYNTSEELRTASTVPTDHPALMKPVKSGRGITFKWHDPPCGSRHGSIVGYEYVLTRDGDDMAPTRTTAPRVRFRQFRPNDRYGFKVRACTEVGCGPYSETETGIF